MNAQKLSFNVCLKHGTMWFYLMWLCPDLFILMIPVRWSINVKGRWSKVEQVHQVNSLITLTNNCPQSWK